MLVKMDDKVLSVEFVQNVEVGVIGRGLHDVKAARRHVFLSKPAFPALSLDINLTKRNSKFSGIALNTWF